MPEEREAGSHALENGCNSKKVENRASGDRARVGSVGEGGAVLPDGLFA